MRRGDLFPDPDTRPAHEVSHSVLLNSIMKQHLTFWRASSSFVLQHEPQSACLRAIGAARDTESPMVDLPSPLSDQLKPVSARDWPLWTSLKIGDLHVRRPGCPQSEASSPPSVEEWHQKQKHTLCLSSVLSIRNERVGWLAVSFCHQVTLDEKLHDSIHSLTLQSSLLLQLKQMTEIEKDYAVRRAIIDERNRIAHDMHDSIAHSYTGILMQLEAAKELLPTKPEIVQDCIDRATDAARKGLQQSREAVRMMQGSFPEALSNSVPALVAEWDQTGIAQCTFTLIGVSYRLPVEVERQMYRVCQEALSNAQLHAHALNIDVTLSYAPDFVSVSVSDNGIGFSLGQVVDLGLGLSGMTKRAERIAAELFIRSNRGEGTTICLRWTNQTSTRENPSISPAATGPSA